MILANMKECVMAYIDDIIFSRNFRDHLEHLDAVFSRLEETSQPSRQRSVCRVLEWGWKSTSIGGKSGSSVEVSTSSKEEGHKGLFRPCQALLTLLPCFGLMAVTLTEAIRMAAPDNVN